MCQHGGVANIGRIPPGWEAEIDWVDKGEGMGREAGGATLKKKGGPLNRIFKPETPRPRSHKERRQAPEDWLPLMSDCLQVPNGGLRSPIFLDGFQSAGATQTHEISDSRISGYLNAVWRGFGS